MIDALVAGIERVLEKKMIVGFGSAITDLGG